MKVVILAGGFGTRISEESHLRPKPMIEIGEHPILWHIMKIYSWYGFSDFVICLGYKGEMIKEYFAHYLLRTSDVTFDFSVGDQPVIHSHSTEPWKVTLVNTGLSTMTGGRVKRVAPYLEGKPFMLTYGDGVADVNVKTLLEFHRSHGRRATVTAAQPRGKFGALDMEASGKVLSFSEKPRGDGGWVNGGFFVLEPEVLEYIEDDTTVFERAPLERLAQEKQLVAFRHEGFWQPMDVLRDKKYLEELWRNGQAPWKVWK
jgi:glucose-1-phosphate cytidylyltransferase